MEHAAYDRIFAIEHDLWWYRGRRMICRALLARHLPPDGTRHVLDVGCGTGYNMTMLADWGQVHGIDMAPEALDYCRQRGMQRVSQGEATALPCADASFDLVTAFDLIEHVEDDHGALREFHRVLRPGGYLLVYTPGLPFMYSEHDRIVHHHRRYWKGELLARMRSAGFQVVHSSYVNMLVLPAVFLVQLLLRFAPRRPHVEMALPPAPINAALTAVAQLEMPVVLGPGLPIGLSLVALARRHDKV
ncbi:MAG: class I SAM-dependent methyltransferase [Candidatus Xenobia bacterium]